MLTHTRAALVALCCSGFALAGGEGWTSDFAAAKKEAAESKKDLLIDFTGSDWCGWCIKLNKEVFSHQAFKDASKDKFVLVELDFPNDKSKLSEETQAQNKQLSEVYGIEGFPTILLTDAEGRPFATTGYQEGGAENYVKHLDELLAKKTVRDNGFKAASALEGTDKAKAYIAIFDSLGLDDSVAAKFYPDIIEQIRAADPEDTTGFTKRAAVKEKMAQFEDELNGKAQKKDFDGALKLIDDTLKEGGLPPDETQQVSITRAMIFAEQSKFDEAIKAVQEARAISPSSELASRLDGFVEQLKEAKTHGAEDKNPNGD